MALSSYTRSQLWCLSKETYRDREKQLCLGRRGGGRAYKRLKYSNSYGLKQRFSSMVHGQQHQSVTVKLLEMHIWKPQPSSTKSATLEERFSSLKKSSSMLK